MVCIIFLILKTEEKMKEKLNSIYNALNNLEVKGRNNCAIIAGVMNVLEELYNECEQNEKKEDEEPPKGE